MKEKEIGKLGVKLIRIFITVIMSVLCLGLIYASINWTHDYFTMNDEQICQDSNSTLINGQCHFERNISVPEKRNMLLVGAIAMPIFVILSMVYLILLLKSKMLK